nr:clustered mitochondria protein [Ipomoea batatas]
MLAKFESYLGGEPKFDLADDARIRVKKIPVLRNLCLKEQVGVTVAARKYDLDAVTPFQATDVLNLQPPIDQFRSQGSS